MVGRTGVALGSEGTRSGLSLWDVRPDFEQSEKSDGPLLLFGHYAKYYSHYIKNHKAYKYRVVFTYF